MMFALVEIERTPPFLWYERMLTAGQCLYSLRRHTRPRYWALTFYPPRNISEKGFYRQSVKGLTAAAKLGSVGVVLPPHFPFPALPDKLGLAVSTPIPLLRRLAAPICFYAAEEMGLDLRRLRVALVGRRFSHEMSAAAQEIAVRTRTLTLLAGRDTEAACQGLRARLGIPVGRERSARAHIYIFFSVPDYALNVPAEALCLNFSGGAPLITGGVVADGAVLYPPMALWKSWPEGCDGPALLSALCAQGSVAPSEIGIKGLCCGSKSLCAAALSPASGASVSRR